MPSSERRDGSSGGKGLPPYGLVVPSHEGSSGGKGLPPYDPTIPRSMDIHSNRRSANLCRHPQIHGGMGMPPYDFLRRHGVAALRHLRCNGAGASHEDVGRQTLADTRNAAAWRQLAACALLALVWSGPAGAYDPERDAWLLPQGGAASKATPRRAIDPIEFTRIRATANDQEPEFATVRQRALIDAVLAGDRPQLEKLLNEGVNPNGKPDVFGVTALVHAVERGDAEMVRLLLDAGADADLRGGGYTPLGKAAIYGHARIVRLLLKYGADPDLKSSDGNTPLTAAAAMNRLEVIRALMPARPDYTLFNLQGRTALSVAAMEGFEEAVRIMLEGGVDAAVLDSNGNNALIMANGKAIDEMLVKHGGARR